MATSNARGRTATTSHLATKKSCDLCVSRKRKCDGTSPCSFCVSRGRECHYSPRRPNRPRGYAKRLARGGGAGGHGHGHGHARSWSGRGGGEEKESAAMQMQMQMRMQHRHQDTPAIGWKRVRLSASPATGLVGMEENFFLGWFFDCLGFLPLTDESLIRGTIMEVFLGFSPETATVAKAERSESPATLATPAKEEPEMAKGMGTGTGSSAGGGQERRRGFGSDAASTCTMWCTVAMGALVQGQPPERVAPYMRLARMSLAQCFDTVSTETARAFMMMAYLYNFLRNDPKFHRHLLFARGVVDRLPDNTPQKQEIVDLLARANDTRIYHTTAWEPGELDDYCKDDNSELQLPDVVNKSTLCRLLLEADRRMIKAFLRDHKAQVAAPSSHRDDHQASFSGIERESRPTARPGVTGEGGGLRRRTGAERRGQSDGVGESGVKEDGDDGVAEISAKAGELSICSNRMDDKADPSSPGGETSACIMEARGVLARLQDTSKLPEIGAGVGGIIYNAIFGYLHIVAGSSELSIGVAKIKQCAKVFEKYPGLCRFSTWLHLSHCLMSILAKLEDTGPFEELRNAYNSVRGKDLVEAPAHAEWTMVGFCDHIFCRSIDHLDTRQNFTSTIKPDSDADTADDTSEADHHDRAVACEEDAHSILPSHSHPTTADPDQMLVLPKTEWSDESRETSGTPTLQSLDLAPVAGLSGVGPIETCQSVLSIAGLTGVTARSGDLSSSGSTSPATFCDSQANSGQSPPTPFVTANSVALECYSAGAPIPSSSGLPTQQQCRVMEMPAQVTDATARQMFGEKVAYWGERRDDAVCDAGLDGKASGEQSAFGINFFWPSEH